MENNILYNSEIVIIDKKLVLSVIPPRIQESNKGTYGHVLNIAGSSMYPGAAYLSSLASLKVGAGYSMLATTPEVIYLTASKTPDITYFDLGQSDFGTIPKTALKPLLSVENADVIALGCGLGLDKEVSGLVVNYLKKNSNITVPFVIDADAINACAELGFFDFPMNSVITPHPMELARLMDVDVKEIQSDRIKWAKKACEDFECTVVLKGHRTVVASLNGQVFVNNTGNSALAKAGAGDVLTGMIAGFLAAGISTTDASIAAVFIHGLTGEIASKALSQYSVLASDLLKYIPAAMRIILKED